MNFKKISKLTLGIITSLGLFAFTGTASAVPYLPAVGGTGTSTPPTYGKVLVGNSGGTYDVVATSTLGITQNLSGYIPYIGGINDVDLGAHNFKVDVSTFFVDSINHRVGIGTATPGTPLDIVGASIRQSSSVTDATNKAFRFLTRNYLNAQNDFLLVFGQSKSTANTLLFGGGQTGYTAASTIDFYTGTGNNTDTGTSRMQIDSSGNVSIAGLTASQLLATDSSKNLASLDTATYPSLTELSYVKGVTSAIQTQINGKQASGTYVTGATNSTLTLTGTTLGLNLGNANIFTATQGVTKDSITTTSTDGLNLINNTAATASIYQYSPRLRFRGYGWAVNSGGFSAVSDFIIENRPSIATLNGGQADGVLTFASAGTAGTYTPRMTLDSGGNLAPSGNITMVGNKIQGGTGTGWGSIAFGAGGAGTQTLAISGFNDGFTLPNTLNFKRMQYPGAASQYVEMNNTAGANSVASILLRGSQGNDPGNPIARIWSGSTYTSHVLLGIGNGSTYSEQFTFYSNGKFGIGVTTPSAFLHIIGTTEQSRIGYDASNYYSTTVGSTGGVTFDALGSGSAFTFADKIIAQSTVQLNGYTVATLPSGVQGMTAFATDLLAPTFGAIAVGGGSVVQPVFYNGTQWITY